MHSIRRSLFNKVIHSFAVLTMLIQSSWGIILGYQSLSRMAAMAAFSSIPVAAWASDPLTDEEFEQQQNAAQDFFDNSIKRNMTIPTADDSTKEISGDYQTFNEETGQWESADITGGGGALTTRDLFSGDVAGGQYYDNSSTNHDATYNNEDNLIDKSVELNDDYESFDESTGTAYDGTDQNNSYDAQAWRTIKDFQDRNHTSTEGNVGTENFSPQNTTEDPANAAMWANQDAIQDDIGAYAALGEESAGETIGGCTVTQETVDESEVVTTYNDHSCDRVVDWAEGINECKIERKVIHQWGLVEESWEDGTITECGPRCLEVEIGSPANDSLEAGSGACSTFLFSAELHVKGAEFIDSASIVSGSHEDYGFVRVGSTKVYDSPVGGNPCDSGVVESIPSTDITSQFKNAVADNRVRLQLSLDVGDRGEGSVKFRINTTEDIVPYVTELIETPSDCYTQLFRNGDWPDGEMGYCYAQSWTITEEKDVRNAVSGAMNELGPLIPEEIPHKTALKATGSGYTCDPYQDEPFCVQDEYGDEICQTWDEFVDDHSGECEAYEARSECELTFDGCAPDMRDPITGNCFVNSYEVRCSEETGYDNSYTIETNDCNSSIRCLDGSCDYSDDDKNGDFEKAIASYALMESIEQDNSCNGSGGEAPGENAEDCRIFEAQYLTCKKGWAGMVDCCDLGAGQNSFGALTTYSQLSNANDELAEYGKSFGDGVDAVTDYFSSDGAGGEAVEVINGAWESVSDTVSSSVDAAYNWVDDVGTQVYTEVAEPVVNYIGNIFGSGTGSSTMTTAANGIANSFSTAGDLATGYIDAMKEIYAEICAQITQYIYDLLPQYLQDMIMELAAEAAGEGAASYAAANAGGEALQQVVKTYLGPIMWAYTIYNLVNLAMAIIYKCEEDEYTLDQLSAQKACIYSHTSCAEKVFGVCTLKERHYCCYKSMQTRVIVEQIIPQMGLELEDLIGVETGEGMTYDSATNTGTVEKNKPVCRGFTAQELASIDWDEVDLSEWIAMMKKEDLLKKRSSANADTITGSGHMANAGDRKNVVTRTEEVVDGMGSSIPNRNIGFGEAIWDNKVGMMRFTDNDYIEPDDPTPPPTCSDTPGACSSVGECFLDFAGHGSGNPDEINEEMCRAAFCPGSPSAPVCSSFMN